MVVICMGCMRGGEVVIVGLGWCWGSGCGGGGCGSGKRWGSVG